MFPSKLASFALGACLLPGCLVFASCLPDESGSGDAGSTPGPPDAGVACQCDEPGCGFCPEIEWADVPGGTFMIGCDEEVHNSLVWYPCGFDQLPRHEVELSSFEMMTTEVTVAMFRNCLEAGICLHEDLDDYSADESCNFDRPGFDQNPMNCVTWSGLRRFCLWLGGDLPTEAQWERAARGEHDGLNGEYWIYPWGNEPEECVYAVMDDSLPGCGELSTWPVASKLPTSFGLYDMIGNIHEWVFDWYVGGGYGVGTTGTDPQGPDQDDLPHDAKVVRGGNYLNSITNIGSSLHSSHRSSENHLTKFPGGRCVR
jgi:formylglycine-generating enzyme required for sulfatase activity